MQPEYRGNLYHVTVLWVQGRNSHIRPDGRVLLAHGRVVSVHRRLLQSRKSFRTSLPVAKPCPVCDPRACFSDSCVKRAQEKEVTALAQTVAARWNTESEGVVTVDPKPKVLVLDGYHTSDPGYSDGWYLQTCKKTSLCPKTAGGTCAGERWCHLIRSAGGNPMNADLTTDMTTENKNFGFEDGSVMGISHKELVIWAKDVDVVIMKSGNLSEADMRNLLGEIGGIAAVGNKRVYDTLRKLDNSGRPTFWGHAQIEPNVFMQDVIKIVNGVQSDDGALPQYNHTLVFFRNLLKETMGDDKRCADEANANFKKDRLGCIPTAGCTFSGCLAECTDNFAINDILYWYCLKIIASFAPVLLWDPCPLCEQNG